MKYETEIENIREMINKTKQNNGFTNTLNEELGISDEVTKVTDALCRYIRNKVPFYNVQIDNNGIIHKKSFEFITCFNTPIVFNIDIIVFKDEEEFNNYFNKYEFNSETSSNDNDISLTLGMVNNEAIIEIFYNPIQHELAHLYNKLMSGRRVVMNKKDETLYRKISDRLKDKTINDDERRLLTALYRCCFDDEINAHANGYYQSLKRAKGRLSEEMPLEYQYLNDIRDVINDFDTKYRQYCQTKLGMEPERIKALLNNGIINYCKGIGRARAKYRKENNIKESVHISIYGKPKKLALL